jgi:uncharacterized phage-associated protein
MTLLPIHFTSGGAMIKDTEVTIADVARYILDRFGQMTTMKLQKLCYYTQAWHLVAFKEPLFQSDFAAWDNGPVARDLYDLHRGKYSITSAEIPGQRELSESKKTFVEAVVGAYSTFSGDELSSITHMEDPWKKAFEESKISCTSNVLISKVSIQDFYSSLDGTNSQSIEL